MINYLLFVKKGCSACQKYKDLNVQGVALIDVSEPSGKAMGVYYGVKVVPVMIKITEDMKKIEEYLGSDIDKTLDKIKEGKVDTDSNNQN